MTNLLVLLTLLVSNHWAISDSPDLEAVFSGQNDFFELCTGHIFGDDDDDTHASGRAISVSFPSTSLPNCRCDSKFYQTFSCCLPPSRAPPAALVS